LKTLKETTKVFSRDFQNKKVYKTTKQTGLDLIDKLKVKRANQFGINDNTLDINYKEFILNIRWDLNVNNYEPDIPIPQIFYEFLELFTGHNIKKVINKEVINSLDLLFESELLYSFKLSYTEYCEFMLKQNKIVEFTELELIKINHNVGQESPHWDIIKKSYFRMADKHSLLITFESFKK